MMAFPFRSSWVGAACGLNKSLSRPRLWRIMTGREEPDGENAMMTWGIDHEWEAVAATSEYLGVIFDHTGGFQRKHGPYCLQAGSCVLEITCHPDGQYGDRVGLEVKCPCNIKMGHVLYEDIRPTHMAQIQSNALVCGFDQVIYSCWTPDASRVWIAEASATYIDWMQDRLSEFGGFLVRDEVPTKLPKRPKPPEVKVELLPPGAVLHKSYAWEAELREACSMATKGEHLELLRKSFPARLRTGGEIDRMAEIMDERASLLAS